MRRFADEMNRAPEDLGFGRSLLASWGFGRWRGLMRGLGPEEGGWSPTVEFFRRDDKLVVRADLPGLTRDDPRWPSRGGVPVAIGVARPLGVPVDALSVLRPDAPGPETLVFSTIASGAVLPIDEDMVHDRSISLEVVLPPQAVEPGRPGGARGGQSGMPRRQRIGGTLS